jgi:hypothetical protein
MWMISNPLTSQNCETKNMLCAPDTLVPLANSTLILLFSKMVKISKIISSKSKKYCKGK